MDIKFDRKSETVSLLNVPEHLLATMVSAIVTYREGILEIQEMAQGELTAASIVRDLSGEEGPVSDEVLKEVENIFKESQKTLGVLDDVWNNLCRPIWEEGHRILGQEKQEMEDLADRIGDITPEDIIGE